MADLITLPNGIKQIVGADSLATAYVVGNYPYGFKLKTDKYYYVDSDPKKGQRLVEVTKNPKTGLLNKPVKATYKDLVVLYLAEDTGYVTFDVLSAYASVEQIEAFEAKGYLLTKDQADTVKVKLIAKKILAEYFAKNPIQFGGAQ
jgi:hypothetical protein